MTVEELLAMLHDLPINSLKKPIVIDSDCGHITRVSIETITMDCEDDTVVGYIITQDGQLDLPFEFEGKEKVQ